MAHYFDLGPYRRRITTTSDETQLWFDRGLNWIYGYNQDEAKRCFERALRADPDCAMAHWGLGCALGPYLNKEWRFYSEAELATVLPLMFASARRAAELGASGTPAEQALGEALIARYPSSTAADLDTMTGWDHNFAQAMRRVQLRFPADPDVAAVCVEALIMRTPWRLWDLTTGQPTPGADTLEALAILEAGLELDPSHPGLAHMMCHALEMSAMPERAKPAADTLRDLAPANAHLLHMPGHIDVLCGDYIAAVQASVRAIAADKAYLETVGPYGQYTAAICHDNHLMMFAAMLAGRWGPAIEAADMIGSIVTDEVLRRSTPAFRITLEAYVSMRMHVFVRFGRWAEILQQASPVDSSLHPVSRAMHHYARAIANAALDHRRAARDEADRFEEILGLIPDDRHLFNNTSATVLAVARQMMEGELAYHRGDFEAGFDHLRQAVVLNDGLNFTEPWAWMHPPRHALGALLLAQGQVDEAEAVYVADLGLDGSLPRATTHPDNVWSLHGYVECLWRSGQTDAAAMWQPKLSHALQHVDVPITSSCACRLDPT